MSFQGFSKEDFNTFNIDGLEPRMEAITSSIRPKFEQLAQEFTPTLSAYTGDEMYPHIAKHARRTVNPPKDTWIAFAANKRGYKQHPHFQIGLWGTHLFVWFAMIYEAPLKSEYGKAFEKELNTIFKNTPKDFVWSMDHMKPEAMKQSDMTKEDLAKVADRLQNVKKSELLCGIHIDANDPLLQDGDKLINKIDETFKTLLPLYKIAQKL
ncbi:hypothetical protein CIB95_02400 [Lottiidibacillus patelloidae]|uniref:UPF0637 protein CIB95_02400 n=1 Tax=Lottiidibacillus patelloidae TaxID=2670334 RepID=A0A263BXX1_9BACI|nr:DUF1054 domain-containing protein [Lottiidibacillus patelloidae]OZM58438.1 hypothetical protein CIB95_02400 [Lottiidibacillus patelloidae]